VPLGEEVAKEVARLNDMIYEGPEPEIDGFHYLVKMNLPKKTFTHKEDITNQLEGHDLVTTASQIAVKARSHRSVVFRNIASSKSNDFVRPTYTEPRNMDHEIPSNYAKAYNDKYWNEMWYYQDRRKDPSKPVVDMNIVPVFYDLKITGEGVNITVPDDGLDWTHPEIRPSFKQSLSYNYISNNHDIYPGKDGSGTTTSHGTRCAGEIIMKPNNNLCGVGSAYGANIGGIKFLDDESNDVRESKVLKYALKYVHIYSNSWGPADTGTFMENLTPVVRRSLAKGIHRGRDGKGAIYVFAAGNGKADGDNCACDGFVNSIYTIVIASCDDSGHVTHYSERCAAITATAYSGAGFEKNVLTTDIGGTCTNKHTGTSAAAPLVSGIIALALSENSELSWRDIQHLIAWTSQVAPLSDNYGWNMNKAGFFYSTDFGFGLVNALYLVNEVKDWHNVPEMSSCGIRLPQVKDFPISRYKAARIIVEVDGCQGLSGEVNYIESIQLIVSMTYPKRGDIQIAMRSPLGTECHVLESRPKDFNTQGLKRWTFTVLSFWGEPPKGHFVIDIFDTTGQPSNEGVISEITLSIHGTKEAPKHYENGYRSYDNFELPKKGDKPRFSHLSSINNVDGINKDIESLSHGKINDSDNHEQSENNIEHQLNENIQSINKDDVNNLVHGENIIGHQDDNIVQHIMDPMRTILEDQWIKNMFGFSG